jgi:hypothetical protein
MRHCIPIKGRLLHCDLRPMKEKKEGLSLAPQVLIVQAPCRQPNNPTYLLYNLLNLLRGFDVQ